MKLHVQHANAKKLPVKHIGGDYRQKFEKSHSVNSSEKRSNGELSYMMKNAKKISLKDKKK